MRKKLMLTLLILSGIVFLVSAGILFHYWMQDRSDAQVREAVSALWPDNHDAASPDEAFLGLLSANPDTIGWLRIDGTAVDGVVMYAPAEEDKYLHLDFYGNYSVRGTYYVEEQCDIQTSDNIIIYGHRMKDGTMFGALTDFQNAQYAAEHPTIRFHTLYGDHTYQVVAAINTRILGENEYGFRYYQYTGSGDTVRFAEYKAFIESNRLYDTGVELQPGDRLLTLSTCAYHTTDGRFILVAKQID